MTIEPSPVNNAMAVKTIQELKKTISLLKANARAMGESPEKASVMKGVIELEIRILDLILKYNLTVL